jgi:hypothetical protein
MIFAPSSIAMIARPYVIELVLWLVSSAFDAVLHLSLLSLKLAQTRKTRTQSPHVYVKGSSYLVLPIRSLCFSAATHGPLDGFEPSSSLPLDRRLVSAERGTTEPKLPKLRFLQSVLKTNQESVSFMPYLRTRFPKRVISHH